MTFADKSASEGDPRTPDPFSASRRKPTDHFTLLHAHAFVALAAVSLAVVGASGVAVALLKDRISSKADYPARKGDGGDRKGAPTATERTPLNPPQPPRSDLRGLSVLGRFNSLIVDFVSLLAGFISLFGRVGNCPRRSHNINDLSTQIRLPDGPESGFSQYLSVDQRTRSRPTYSATRPFSR